MPKRLEQPRSLRVIERESSDSGFAAAEDRLLWMCSVFNDRRRSAPDALQELEAVGVKLHHDSLNIVAGDRKMVLTGGGARSRGGGRPGDANPVARHAAVYGFTRYGRPTWARRPR